MAKSKNIFVIDTCVLLHDPDCIFKFQEHDIYIPLACIDDLDEIKTRKDHAAWAAREVFRHLNKYEIGKLTAGIVVTADGGKLFVYNPDSSSERSLITRVNSDNAIIDAAIKLKSNFPRRRVVIVTKDTGLGIRAVSWGCVAENYKSDLLNDRTLYEGYRTVELEDVDDWNKLLKRNPLDPNSLSCKSQLKELNPNEFIDFKYGKFSVFGWWRHNRIEFLAEEKRDFCGIKAKNTEQKFALEALGETSIPLVSLSGPAGSGKTLCAIAAGLDAIANQTYDRMIVMKPMIAVGGKDIGFLPGSKLEKVIEWLGPIKDNITQLTSKSGYGGLDMEDLINEGKIEVEAMAFIQGRSIPRSFIILDEAENVSPKEVRMVIERCGKDSKVVLLGDMSQIENPYLDKHSCGLAHAINGSKTFDIAASVNMHKVERSELAAVASQIFRVK